jgi:hypothetical protein
MELCMASKTKTLMKNEKMIKKTRALLSKIKGFPRPQCFSYIFDYIFRFSRNQPTSIAISPSLPYTFPIFSQEAPCAKTTS